MKQKNHEIFILLMILVAGTGLFVESVLFQWEFWTIPLIALAMLAMFALYVLKNTDYTIRKTCYFLFAFLAVFYHGVHSEGLIPLALSVAFILSITILLESMRMLLILFAEYIVLIGIRLFVLTDWENAGLDVSGLMEIIFSLLIVSLIYWNSVRMLQERNALQQLLEQKDEKLEAANADMEEFLNGISNELRTPVNVVNGMTEMLVKRQGGAEVESIRKAGSHLAHRIEDIQDYTECRSGKVQPEEEVYRCTALINDVVRDFRTMDRSDQLELVVDLDPMVPSRMQGDVGKIYKICRHLLANAVKFTRKGGIYLRMFAEEKEYGVNLCIEFTDTGIGMDRSTVAAVSEELYQSGKKRKRTSAGSGLGLYIVYGFVHRMGGVVKIESDKGIGTTVRVTIPQKVSDKSPCLTLKRAFGGDLIFHVRQDKYRVPAVRDFYRSMAADLATGIHVSLYPTQTIQEIEKLREKLNISMIFMGQEEYVEDPAYFNQLVKQGIVVVVSVAPGFRLEAGSKVLTIPKPVYAYPVIRVLNEEQNKRELPASGSGEGGRS